MKADTKGSSIVSVIVALLILLMGMAMFTTSMYTATDLTKEASAIRIRIENATEKYYKGVTQVEDSQALNFGNIVLEQVDDTGILGSSGGFTISGEGYSCGSNAEESYTMYYFEHQ